MSTSDPITRLFQKARAHRPFGEGSDFGFETRLRALMGTPVPSLSETLAQFSWRFSLVALPLIVILAVIVTVQSHGTLPTGIDSFVAQWADVLPIFF